MVSHDPIDQKEQACQRASTSFSNLNELAMSIFQYREGGPNLSVFPETHPVMAARSRHSAIAGKSSRRRQAHPDDDGEPVPPGVHPRPGETQATSLASQGRTARAHLRRPCRRGRPARRERGALKLSSADDRRHRFNRHSPTRYPARSPRADTRIGAAWRTPRRPAGCPLNGQVAGPSVLPARPGADAPHGERPVCPRCAECVRFFRPPIGRLRPIAANGMIRSPNAAVP